MKSLWGAEICVVEIERASKILPIIHAETGIIPKPYQQFHYTGTIPILARY
jgi:hypothetical protein